MTLESLAFQYAFGLLQVVPNELLAWWDASDLSTLFQDVDMTVPVTTAGDFVAAWADKGPHGWHLYQTGTKRPAYRTSGFKGAVPNLQFDGSDDFMRTATPSPFTQKQPLTIFSSLQMAAGISRVAYDGTEAGGVCSLLCISPTWRITAGAALVGSSNDGLPHVHVARFKGVDSLRSIDGVTDAAGNAGISPLLGFTVGGDRSGASVLNGRVSEIKIYACTLADFESAEAIRLLAKNGF